MGDNGFDLADVTELAKAKVAELTLDEKIAYLCAEHPAIERLGYPAYRLEAEGAHGLVIRDGNSFLDQTFDTTVFPETFGLSLTWDRDLLRQIGDVISDEARAFNCLMLFSPTIDLARDPRWGRNEEAYGEDPFLAGQLGEQYIKGLQGDQFPYLKTGATAKHFYANNYEFERDWDDSVVPEKLKRDYYLRPFETAFVDAKAVSVMTGYNMINGTVGMLNPELNSILRQEWGADGYFVSDGKAPELLTEMYGKLGDGDEVESLARYMAKGLAAGMDCYLAYDDDVVIAAVERGLEMGLITEAMIDTALTRQFAVMLRLGLIPGLPGNPYLTDAIHNQRGTLDISHSSDNAQATPSRHSADTPQAGSAETSPAQYPDHTAASRPKDFPENTESAALARRAANEAVVLLKNDGLLPLNPEQTQKLAVIGQLGDENMRDWYSGQPAYQVTPLAGIRKAFPNTEVMFDDGCDRVSFYYDASSKAAPPGSTPNKGWLRVLPDGSVTFDGDELNRGIFRALDWGYGFAFQDVGTGRYLTTTDPGELRADATEVWGWFARPVFFLNKPNAYSQTWPLTGMEVPSPVVELVETKAPAVELVETKGEQVPFPTGITGIPITDDADINNAKFSPIIPFGTPAQPFGAKRAGKNQYLVLFNEGGADKLNQTLSHLTVKVIDSGLKRAAQLAQSADVAIVLMGNHSLIGARECVDRPSTALPERWGVLFDKVTGANPNSILAIIAGFQYAIGVQEQEAKAVLFTTHGLQEVGTAIGQTLSGANNPSGRLSQTWYADDFEFGSMSNYDIADSKLTYLYTDKPPLHPFGFGLSYTSFAYTDFSVTPMDDGVAATFTITNTGQVPGTAVPQIYLAGSAADSQRHAAAAPIETTGQPQYLPNRQLVGFDRVNLQPGESRQVTIPIRKRELSSWDSAQQRFTVNPGDYQFELSTDSANPQQTATVELP